MIHGTTILLAAVLAASACRSTQASDAKLPRFCLTISVDLRADLREEVSVIDLVIKNASVVSIPRFPAGWAIKIQNYVDNTPTSIFGGATGGVAELQAKDLKCLFELEDSVPGTPQITVKGSVYVSNGETERRIFLHHDQIVLERIRSE